MEKELIENLEYVPEVNTYWFWAIQLLMLRDSGNYVEWLMNNYVEIIYGDEILPQEIYFLNDRVRNKTVELYNCPFWQMQKIDFDENHLIMGKTIVNFVKECINQKKYVLLMVNRLFIKTYGFNEDNLHQILIHGYNEELGQFYYADNGRNGKFENKFICTFEELENSFINSYPFENEPDFSTSVFTFFIRKLQEYPVNILRIKRMMSSYLNCTSLAEDYYKFSGIKVYQALIDYYETCLRQNTDINVDVRGLCTLRDHHNAMRFRLEHLRKQIDVKSEWIKAFEVTTEKSDLAINIMVKYRIDKRKEHINRLVDVLKDVYRIEIRVIPDIIETLSLACNSDRE